LLADVLQCGRVAGALLNGSALLSGEYVDLYTVRYHYVKQHKSLKGISPAMAADIVRRRNL
jgi:hypothetical protein